MNPSPETSQSGSMLMRLGLGLVIAEFLAFLAVIAISFNVPTFGESPASLACLALIGIGAGLAQGANAAIARQHETSRLSFWHPWILATSLLLSTCGVILAAHLAGYLGAR